MDHDDIISLYYLFISYFSNIGRLVILHKRYAYIHLEYISSNIIRSYFAP